MEDGWVYQMFRETYMIICGCHVFLAEIQHCKGGQGKKCKLKEEIVAFEEGLINNDPEMNEAAKTKDSNK